MSLKYKPYQAAIHHVHDCEIVNSAVAVRQLTSNAAESRCFDRFFKLFEIVSAGM